MTNGGVHFGHLDIFFEKIFIRKEALQSRGREGVETPPFLIRGKQGRIRAR
jgi:hypothetical protein